MEHNHITPIGFTNFHNKRQLFGIKADDRRRHVYIIGKTGMGKTTLLENMVISDMRAGRGMAIVDPHGEFAEKMLDYVPSSRIKDVVYFNPADYDFPIAFNVVEQVAPERRHLIASGLVGVFKKIWADSWGPRLEYILRNTILSLMEYPDATLLDIMRMLGGDSDYRKHIISAMKDPILLNFWVDEFAKYNQQFQSEAVAPIQNKVGQFLTSPLIRNIVGQHHSAIDIREIMDGKRILILNLSKGRIGEDNSALLGAMIITKIQLAALERIDIAEHTRQDFYLYVDEFQSFATDSFANILSEARKYRLNLTLTHQYIQQLDQGRTTPVVRDAVFGNVGTIVSFRVGAEDSEFLEREFMPTFVANDLVNLAKYQVYIKLMIDGVASDPFSAETMPTLAMEEPSSKAAIIIYSREHYASARADVERMIAKVAGVVDEGPAPSLPPRSMPDQQPSASQLSNPSPMIPTTIPAAAPVQPSADSLPTKYFAACWKCQATIKVPFKPDGRRPVFCKDCFKKAQTLKEAGQIPAVAAYIDYNEAAAAGGATGGGPARGFAVLKDLIPKILYTGQTPSVLPAAAKVTHYVTEPVVRPDATAEAKRLQEEKRSELKALLTESLNEVKKNAAAMEPEKTKRPETAKVLKSGAVIKPARRARKS